MALVTASVAPDDDNMSSMWSAVAHAGANMTPLESRMAQRAM